jgi:hypothetical protein
MTGRLCVGIVMTFTGLALLGLLNCGSNSQPLQISVKSGSGQSALPNAAFSAPLVATVTKGGKPVAGAQVTFAGPASGATGTFANGTASDNATTDATGVATSGTFAANSTPGSYVVKVNVAGAATSASFELTNIAATYFSFYLSGLETINNTKGPNFYACVGSVAIDANGKVVAGKQDYNDGFGLTSPQPSGDAITGGALAVDASGQGTLTLVTDNIALGTSGNETLGVQFVNAKHALIVQFDGSATSSGSMDMQLLPSAISGGFAFTLSGVDPTYSGIGYGGVFSANNSAINGTSDVNDGIAAAPGEAFSGALTPPDNFGRGQFTGVNIDGFTISLDYYIVGPGVIRIIDVNTTDSAIGSAFGQGTNSTGASEASIANSVFGVEPNSWGFSLYAAVGALKPNAANGTFTGVADSNEEGTIVRASPIGGTYTIGSNGYGGISITNAGLADFTSFGVYATDPNLNLLDPNNPVGGGGALLLALDPKLAGGTGILIPQTDTATSSFANAYAFGANVYDHLSASGWEFDQIGQGSVTAGIFSGTGLVNDAFGAFSSTSASYKTVPFTGTATADAQNPGRYTIAPLDCTPISGSPTAFSVILYQASDSALFWMNEDQLSLSLGTLQRTAMPALGAKRANIQKLRAQFGH